MDTKTPTSKPPPQILSLKEYVLVEAKEKCFEIELKTLKEFYKAKKEYKKNGMKKVKEDLE